MIRGSHIRDPREIMRARGLRYSRPRAAILDFLAERDRHFRAEELHDALRQRGERLSLSTVYLNLAVLREAGLVRELHGLGGEALYDSNVSPHHHLICKVCGAVADLPESSLNGVATQWHLKRHAERHSGWRVDEPSLDLKGTCPKCERSPVASGE